MVPSPRTVLYALRSKLCGIKMAIPRRLRSVSLTIELVKTSQNGSKKRIANRISIVRLTILKIRSSLPVLTFTILPPYQMPS